MSARISTRTSRTTTRSVRNSRPHLAPLLANPALATLAGGIITLTCTGNSSSALNAIKLKDGIKEGEFTGTGVISWKPVDSTLVYASYSRGYKAGGYNLDRSDLGSALFPRSAANASALRFDPETVNAYEAGIKFSSRQFTLNVAAFRQEFSNFQLNTFNGTNYVVQNIGSCSTSLNGADTDNSAATGACTGNVKYGVLSQGVEIEAGIYPMRNFSVNLGYTLSDTKYRNNLVGSQSGEALDPALFMLAEPAALERAAQCRDHLDQLDAGSRIVGHVGALLCRWPSDLGL